MGVENVLTEHLAFLRARGYASKVNVVRPANVTAYTANDVVGGVIAFAAPARAGEWLVNTAELEIDVAAVPAGMTTFRLYLYNVTPPSALADNAAWDLPAGDRAAFIGYVDLGTPVDLGSTLYVRADAKGAQFTFPATGLFGYLVTAGPFTPAANSEVYIPTLRAVAQ